MPRYQIDNDRVEMFVDTDEILDAFVACIRAAKDRLQLEIMIFAADESGITIAEELVLASKKGVRVQILMDHYLSTYNSILPPLSRARRLERKERFAKLVLLMRNAGIEVRDSRKFASLNKVGQGFNCFDHKKLLVKDHDVAIVCSNNISSYSLSISQTSNDINKKRAWHELAVIVRGPSATLLKESFDVSWDGSCRNVGGFGSTTTKRVQAFINTQNCKPVNIVMYELIRRARKKIELVSPFINHKGFLRELVQASRKGVEVNIIFPVKMHHYQIAARQITTRRGLFSKNEINLFEYNEDMIHRKAMMVDNRFSLVGSANFNNRSFRYDIECCLYVDHKGVAEELTEKVIAPYKRKSIINSTEYVRRISLLDGVIEKWS